MNTNLLDNVLKGVDTVDSKCDKNHICIPESTPHRILNRMDVNNAEP